MTAHRMHRSDGAWYAINNRAEQHDGPSQADVYIYAEIGNSWFGDTVSAAQFVDEVAGLDVERINLHLNSPGGDAYEGIAIANVIRQHKAKVIVTVDGLAASAASFIAMAGDEVVMGRQAELMIHDGWGICIGNADDMTDVAKRLNQVSDSIASMYADKAGGTIPFWRDAMRAETWYSAEEAVQAGLADRMLATQNSEAEKVKNRFDLSIFNHAGRAKAPPPKIRLHNVTPVAPGPPVWVSKGEYLIPAGFATGGLVNGLLNTTPPASPAEPVRKSHPFMEGADIMSDTLTSGLRERLGIPADTEIDEDGLLTALDEALAERSEPQNRAPELPPGTVMIEQAVLDSLRDTAEMGRQAREQQLTTERNSVVEAAVQDGRIAPSRREHWIKALLADPGARDVLADLAPGTVPLKPIGYTGGIDETSDDDRLYAKLYGTEA